MVKTFYDYVDALQEKFPIFPKEDIIKICNFGLMRFSWVNKMHCDVIMKDHKANPFIAFTGLLKQDRQARLRLWAEKWRMKERALYLLKGKKWDGYYYIGLSEEQHQKLLRQRKTKKLRNVYLVKVIDEMDHQSETISKYIWRVPYPIDCGWKFFVEKLDSEYAEFVRQNKYEEYHKHV